MGHYPEGNGSSANWTNQSIDTQDIDDNYDVSYRVRAMFSNPHDMAVIIIGVIAIMLNMLVLCALHTSKTHLTTHYRLIISLAVSDVVVGGSVMLHVINKTFNPVYKPGGDGYQTERLISKCTYLAIKALNSTGLIITLLNLMAMATDHYLAIMKPLRHPILLRKARVVALIAVLWGISIILGFSDFLSAFHIYRSNYEDYGYNYCELVWLTKYREEYMVLSVAPICFAVMLYIYLKIYVKICRHRRPGTNPLEKRGGIRKTKKALITTLLNLGTFVVTWLPACLFQIALLIKVRYQPHDVRANIALYAEIDKYLFDLLMLNAIADSVIYTVRIREVKTGFHRMFSCCTPRRNFFLSTRETSFSNTSIKITRGLSNTSSRLNTFL